MFLQSKCGKYNSDEFDKNIPAIESIKLSSVVGLAWFETHTITIDGNTLWRDDDGDWEHWKDRFPGIQLNSSPQITKDTLFSAIREMHMSEWYRWYDNSDALDGIIWDVKISYHNGHEPITFSGMNDYPYNFNDFLKLFGIEDPSNVKTLEKHPKHCPPFRQTEFFVIGQVKARNKSIHMKKT